MNNMIPTENIKLPEAVANVGQNIGENFNNFKANVNNNFADFSQQSTAAAGASTEYLKSNTIVAKFAFLILVVIVFLFLLSLGIKLIQYFITPSDNPYLINGTIDGNYSKIISQDPKQKDAVSIKRSNNEKNGLEFTWSVWLYLNDIGTDSTKYQHIFSKGDSNFNSSKNNIATVNNGPGLYLAPSNNALYVVMNTSATSDDTNYLLVDNVPIRKWFHVAIRMQNTVMDVYVNGVISGRLNLPFIPKQNYNDVNVCQNGGFSGKLSDLRYYSHAMSVIEINNVVYWGPNTKPSTADTSTASGDYKYLSTRWYSARI